MTKNTRKTKASRSRKTSTNTATIIDLRNLIASTGPVDPELDQHETQSSESTLSVFWDADDDDEPFDINALLASRPAPRNRSKK